MSGALQPLAAKLLLELMTIGRCVALVYVDTHVYVCGLCDCLTIVSSLCQLYLHCKKLTILSAKNVDRKKAEENKKEINETATTSREHMQASMAVRKT